MVNSTSNVPVLVAPAEPVHLPRALSSGLADVDTYARTESFDIDRGHDVIIKPRRRHGPMHDPAILSRSETSAGERECERVINILCTVRTCK